MSPRLKNPPSPHRHEYYPFRELVHLYTSYNGNYRIGCNVVSRARNVCDFRVNLGCKTFDRRNKTITAGRIIAKRKRCITYYHINKNRLLLFITITIYYTTITAAATVRAIYLLLILLLLLNSYYYDVNAGPSVH